MSTSLGSKSRAQRSYGLPLTVGAYGGKNIKVNSTTIKESLRKGQAKKQRQVKKIDYMCVFLC